jgi:hypothetical protein
MNADDGTSDHSHFSSARGSELVIDYGGVWLEGLKISL